jgi:hypothetical protein
MNFMGIESLHAIVIEGVDALPHLAAELMRQGSDACRLSGATFQELEAIYEVRGFTCLVVSGKTGAGSWLEGECDKPALWA